MPNSEHFILFTLGAVSALFEMFFSEVTSYSRLFALISLKASLGESKLCYVVRVVLFCVCPAL